MFKLNHCWGYGTDMTPGMKQITRDQSGVSLIAAIFIIIVLAFMGVMFLTLTHTATIGAVSDLHSAQALFIAEGGLQYTLAFNRNNIPNYSTNGAWHDLGAGRFKVDTPAYVTAAFNANDATLTVNTTAGFPSAGRLTIGTDFNITYSVTTPNSFQNIQPVPHQIHNVNDSVYPAARLMNTINNDPACGALPQIDIVEDPSGFEIPGIIFIDTEYFYCTGMDNVPPGYAFQNCQRCYANSSPAAHPSTRYASQYALTSTGRVASIYGDAERVVRINAGPYDD